MSSFEAQTRLYREKIEAYLKEVYAPFLEEPQKLIFEAANYSLLAGGKRLRPFLLWISAGCAARIPPKPCPLQRPWKWSIPTA